MIEVQVLKKKIFHSVPLPPCRSYQNRMAPQPLPEDIDTGNS